MTTAAQLLTELQALGVTLAADGDRLRFRPGTAVTPELLARLRTHKAELLAMLARTGDSGDGDETHPSTGETVVVSPAVPQDASPGGDRGRGGRSREDAGPSDADSGIRCPWCSSQAATATEQAACGVPTANGLHGNPRTAAA